MPDRTSSPHAYAYGTREGLARYLPAHESLNPTVQQKYASNLQIALRKIVTAAKPPSTDISIPE